MSRTSVLSLVYDLLPEARRWANTIYHPFGLIRNRMCALVLVQFGF